jgi:hypothetical protein
MRDKTRFLAITVNDVVYKIIPPDSRFSDWVSLLSKRENRAAGDGQSTLNTETDAMTVEGSKREVKSDSSEEDVKVTQLKL